MSAHPAIEVEVRATRALARDVLEFELARADWRLVYLARSEERAAYLDELRELDASRVSLHVSGPGDRRLDLASLLHQLGERTNVWTAAASSPACRAAPATA